MIVLFLLLPLLYIRTTAVVDGNASWTELCIAHHQHCLLLLHLNSVMPGADDDDAVVVPLLAPAAFLCTA